MTTHTFNLFGIDTERIDEQHLLDLVKQGAFETIHFEAKSGHGFPNRTEHIIPAIVGFLNTNGGVLWIGAPEEEWIDDKNKKLGKKFTSKPVGHDPVSLDSIRRKLTGSIEPPPSGIRFSDPVKMADGKYSTIIEVPQSDYPPHQYKGTYYLRLDGETVKAPHGLVEALFFRRRGPWLIPNLELVMNTDHVIDRKDYVQVRMILTLENIGRFAAEDYLLDFEIQATVVPSYSTIEGQRLRVTQSEKPARFCIGKEDLNETAFPGRQIRKNLVLAFRMRYADFLNIPVKITVNAVNMVGCIYEFDITDNVSRPIFHKTAMTIYGDPLPLLED